MANLLKEIKDEIKQEEWQKFWFSYGLYAIICVVVLLCFAGGYLMWSHMSLRHAEEQSYRYDQALSLFERGEYAKAEELFKKLAENTGSGYGQLARVCLVGVAQRRALATYDKEWMTFWRRSGAYLMQDFDFSLSFRSALALNLAYGLLDFSKDMSTASEQKKALLTYETPENPWKGLSLEAQALWSMVSGDTKAAIDLWQRGFKDASLSGALRIRCEKGLIFVGGEIPYAP